MRTTKKIITIGRSLGIIIDKPILKKLELSRGDLVEVNVRKIKDPDSHRWNKNNKERRKEYIANWNQKQGDDEILKKRRNYHSRKKAEAHKLLGNKCVKCGIQDHRVLQIDHIDGGGTKERKEIRLSGTVFHVSVIESVKSNENKYQLLCSNCNWIKRFENKEHC